MYKRLAAIILAAILAFVPLRVYSQENLEELRLDEDLPEAAVVISISGDSIPAKSAILLDQASGQVLHEQNADEQLPPASVTKVMTLLLVMEAVEDGRISLEDMVSVSAYASSMGGSQIWLKEGEQMSVDDLLKAVSIASANDASVALAEHVAGTEDAFLQMMNARAAELGMNNTHFLNCTGLDEEGHLTTARDIALMARELIQHELVRNYSMIWMDSLRNGETELVNTNKLVRFYEGATGLKTGTTSGAGSCLAATATRGEMSLVAVVMGSPTSDERFSAARGLLDYGFANYISVTPPPIEEQLTPIKVIQGVEESVAVTYQQPGSFVVEKMNEDSITQTVTLVEDVEAPVVPGQTLGKAEIFVSGTLVGEYNLTAAQGVERMTFGKAFGFLLSGIFKTNAYPATPDRVEEILPDGDGEELPAADGEAEEQTGEGEEAPAEPVCTCTEGECYCADIGDVCGCTRS